MLTVKCALEEELKQMTKDISLEYRQQRTNWPIAKIEYFRQCVGFKQKFEIPPGALFYQIFDYPFSAIIWEKVEIT